LFTVTLMKPAWATSTFPIQGFCPICFIIFLATSCGDILIPAKEILMLTLQRPVITICTTYFNTTKTLHCAYRVYLFHMVLTMNSSVLPKQHWPDGLCSRNITCSLWSMKRTFIYYLEEFQSLKS
jgi:hypothetical protein